MGNDRQIDRDDGPPRRHTEPPPEPGTLKWWRLQLERPAEELKSDEEIQMQLRQLAAEMDIPNTDLPITPELTLIQRFYAIKPEEMEAMTLLELIRLQRTLNKQEEKPSGSLNKYRYGEPKTTWRGNDTVRYVEPYNPRYFGIPWSRLPKQGLQKQSQAGRKKTPESDALNKVLQRCAHSASQLNDSEFRRTLFQTLDREKVELPRDKHGRKRKGSWMGLLRRGKEGLRLVLEALKGRIKSLRKKPKSARASK